MPRFRSGDYVCCTQGGRAMTGTVVRCLNVVAEKYLVRFDPRSNDTEFVEEGVYYADELRLCSLPSGV
jgi:hypothetical protein